jgi:23S rRNA (guanine2445-N2)-methyltransferase
VTVSLFLPCAAGVEEFLAEEIGAIATAAPTVARGGVAITGNALLAMRVNLESRLAQRVLWRVAEGPYRGEDDLYALARSVRWADWISPKQTLRVDTTARNSPLKSLNFAALRIKDAVCDVMREHAGARPNVDTRDPDLSLVLHLDGSLAQLYVDTSGAPLFKRGWRDAQAGDAPLKETLAAALLAATGWRGRAEDGPLLDPCCGAGTIAIEAAQLACGRAPGLERRFGFERLAPFRDHAAAWRALQGAARARMHASAVPIFAGDVSFRMTDFAQRHAARAGVVDAIAFKAGDMLQRMPPVKRGTMLLNPPYGERLAPKGSGSAKAPAREQAQGAPDTASFFAALAAHWKRHYAGWTAWILSPDAKLPSVLRLKESRRVPLWNGPIECRLFRFEMVAGSARGTRAAAPPPPDEGD